MIGVLILAPLALLFFLGPTAAPRLTPWAVSVCRYGTRHGPANARCYR